MRIPTEMPMLGWTADASYANVPQGMSLSMNNVIPNDQYQGRTRLATRASLQIADWLGTGGGSIGTGSDYPIQCVVACSNYADSTGSGGAQVRVDRLVIVAGGRIFQMLPGALTTAVSSGAIFNTTGPVSGVQFKNYVYFCDGGAEGTGETETNHHYYKLKLEHKVAVNGDITAWGTTAGNLDDPTTDVSGPNSVAALIDSKYYSGSLLVKMGARLAMAGVKSAEETWFLSAIDDPQDWNPQSGTTTDALAGGTNAAEGYGTIGEPIEALIPFGQSGLLICGKTSLTYLAGDPAVVGPMMHTMSRSLGVAGRDAWCAGPNQSAYVLTREGLLNLQPNIFAVDKSSMVSRGRLDSFFSSRNWDKITPVLVHDVDRQGVWIWLNNSDQPQQSEHLFYSYATNGFFPITMAHTSFTGATCGTSAIMETNGTPMVVVGSEYGVIGCFDPDVICGSDGQDASWVTSSTWSNGDSTRQISRGNQTNVPAAIIHRIESEVSIGPLFVPEPNEMLIREITIESALDEYLPDTAMKGETNQPRVELVYGESVQAAVGNDVSNLTLTMESELIVDGGYWDADSEAIVLDGSIGVDADGAGGSDDVEWREPIGTDGAGTGLPHGSTIATDGQGMDGGGSSRPWASTTWQANTLFVSPENRKYYPTADNGYYLERIAYPQSSSSKKWVARYNDGSLVSATYHETTTGATSHTPVTYIQREDPFGSGVYPVTLQNQRFHGVRRPLVDGATTPLSAGEFVYGFPQAPNFASGGIAGSEFGTFDADTIDQKDTYLYQWADVIDGTTYPDHRQDIFHTHTGETDDINILDLGCLDRGRGNRRRCRVRALVAFVRIRGTNGGDGNFLATATSGHPFVLERMTVEADAVGQRSTVEVESCFGSDTDQDGDVDTDPTDSEGVLGSCCVGETCNDNGGRGITKKDCNTLVGTWHHNLCTANDCSTVGACCYSVGGGGTVTNACELLTSAECAKRPSGEHHGAGTACADYDCTIGKCCFCGAGGPHEDHGVCTNLFASECSGAGGTWTEGVLCDPSNPAFDCCQSLNTGACCKFDPSDGSYTCTELVTEEYCTDTFDGTYFGNGSTCIACGEPILCCVVTTGQSQTHHCLGVMTCDECSAAAPNVTGYSSHTCDALPEYGPCGEVGCNSHCYECMQETCGDGNPLGRQFYISPCDADFEIPMGYERCECTGGGTGQTP